MADATQDELQAHEATYQAFSKLVLFMILLLILILSTMALGLVAHVPVLALLLGIGGTLALIIGFAVLG
ncbi:MAG: aa3-type cytochrome c oxidase subunit IV [Proteobacteria bacterium]|nr:aa3-type cytochrome c oxidase subunit IV [Pseudomonadota bacterium]